MTGGAHHLAIGGMLVFMLVFLLHFLSDMLLM
jgi:hypothetical protein